MTLSAAILHAALPAGKLVHGGAYTVDGKRYPRVSTIIDVICKPNLHEWRRKVGDAEANRISQEAADRGTRVHKLCEDADLDQMTSCPAELRPFLEAYLDWKRMNVAEVVMVERRVVHRAHVYAGTLDRLYRLNSGALALADLKTGKSVDAVYRLQQTAYAEALAEEGINVDQRFIVHMPSNQPGVLAAFELDEPDKDRLAWRACLRLWRWHERHKEDWKHQGAAR